MVSKKKYFKRSLPSGRLGRGSLGRSIFGNEFPRLQ
jgi:hypothetical protein